MKVGDQIAGEKRSRGHKTQKLQNSLVVMSLEIFCHSRKALLPNPRNVADEVAVVMWSTAECIYSAESEDVRRLCGSITVAKYSAHGQPGALPASLTANFSVDSRAVLSSVSCSGMPNDGTIGLEAVDCRDRNVHYSVSSERALFMLLIEVVRCKDPDFIVGYDVQRGSWGWLIERAAQLSPPIDLLQELSRVPTESANRRNEFDVYGEEHESGIWITGRTVLNLWRRMRSELKLSRYTVESVTAHVLNKRLPHFTAEQLTSWFRDPRKRSRVYRHLYRAGLSLWPARACPADS